MAAEGGVEITSMERRVMRILRLNLCSMMRKRVFRKVFDIGFVEVRQTQSDFWFFACVRLMC